MSEGPSNVRKLDVSRKPFVKGIPRLDDGRAGAGWIGGGGRLARSCSPFVIIHMAIGIAEGGSFPMKICGQIFPINSTPTSHIHPSVVDTVGVFLAKNK